MKISDSLNNYYSYGSLQSGQSYESGKSRYGFNGLEVDGEIGSFGKSYTTEFREYNADVGRWWSLDPKPTASEIWYVGMGNNPILFTDVRGDKVIFEGPNSQKYETTFLKIIDYLWNSKAYEAASMLQSAYLNPDFTIVLNVFENSRENYFNGSVNFPQIYWDPVSALKTLNFEKEFIILSPAEILVHEFGEFFQVYNRKSPHNQKLDNNPNSGPPLNPDYDTKDDEDIITGVECETYNILHKIGPLAPRSSHSDKRAEYVTVQEPISNSKTNNIIEGEKGSKGSDGEKK